GADALRRSVRLQGGVLVAPSPPARQDIFGERTSLIRVTPGGLAVVRDVVGLFGGLRFVGDFSLIERSEGLPPGVRILATAGREPDHPAFVAYRPRKGIVIRSGTSQWAK